MGYINTGTHKNKHKLFYLENNHETVELRENINILLLL